VAPKLAATKGDFPPSVDQQIALQRQDEKAILSIVSSIKQRYNITESQVFMTGWSAASFTILHTGLRNPEVFRALFIRQGSFDAKFMDVPPDRLDTWQRIRIIYGHTDFLRDQTKASIAWLRENKMYVQEEELPGAHRRVDPTIAWAFFKETSRKYSWIRVNGKPAGTDDPLTMKFSIDAIPPVTDLRWVFDDGTDSSEASPSHTFKTSGPHEVKAKVSLKGGKKYVRKRVFNVGIPRDN
jgi:hypothetical protein